MVRRRVRNNEVEDDVAQLLTLFYHYIADRCEPGSANKLEKLMATLESLAGDKEKVRRLSREVWRQFREDAIFCQIPSRHNCRH